MMGLVWKKIFNMRCLNLLRKDPAAALALGSLLWQPSSSFMGGPFLFRVVLALELKSQLAYRQLQFLRAFSHSSERCSFESISGLRPPSQSSLPSKVAPVARCGRAPSSSQLKSAITRIFNHHRKVFPCL